MINKNQYLQLMGITPWVSRETPANFIVEQQPTSINPIPNQQATTDWESLQKQVSACTACGLHKTRTQTVFGVGNRNADLLIVGEAPGAQEDRLGEPFVGRAGHLLDAMLQAIQLNRSQIYIANILKCRPPNNRDPNAEEVALCTPFLQQQINLLKPKLILALGRIAAHFLLKTNTALGSLRGKTFHYGEANTPLIVTYHPAYLLRSPSDKRKAYGDLLTTQQLLNTL